MNAWVEKHSYIWRRLKDSGVPDVSGSLCLACLLCSRYAGPGDQRRIAHESCGFEIKHQLDSLQLAECILSLIHFEPFPQKFGTYSINMICQTRPFGNKARSPLQVISHLLLTHPPGFDGDGLGQLLFNDDLQRVDELLLHGLLVLSSYKGVLRN